MKILIDIGHPGHMHLFKHFACEMQKRGHEFLFTCRQKEFEIELLESAEFNYKSFGKHYKTTTGKIWGLLKFNLLILRTAIKFKPDIFLSAGSIYAAQVAWLVRKNHIALEDTGNMEQVKIYRPFSTCILTPCSLNKKLGEKQICYSGYHELAYLHPKRFKPDKSIFELLGIEKNERYIIIRFVSWNATHDLGQKGINLETKKLLVNKLSKICKVFITSEAFIPSELTKFEVKIPPDRIHDLLAYSDLYIGEGATMSNESSILGIPAIYVNSRKACIGDLEKYGLLFHYKNSKGVLEKAFELLDKPNLKKEFQERRKKMLADKIDVTAFMIWFVENYTESARIMKENPDYQYRFR